MSKQRAQLEQYRSRETLAGIPSHSDIISECNNELTAILQQSLSDKQPIYFMPNDVSDATDYIVVVPEEIYDNCRKKILQQKGDCIEYPNVVKKFNKKINIDYYIESLFGLCTRFINYDNKYQLSSESLLKVMDHKKKSKKKKLKIAKDLLQSNDSPSLDEDEIAKIKDEELQKLAKKWLKNYIKNLCDALKKDEAIISYLWKNATTQAEKICSGISKAGITRSSSISAEHNNYLNILDKITNSTYSKLLNLLSKLSKLNVEYRNAIYDLITQVQKRKPKITILEQYIFLYDLELEYRELIDFQNI
ncbi:3602_t:CDS:2 [Cetraspora pellucida]|uniref:3602_t:CDS:1 n=1 Tax=Cetraspora pellucida TaxID=1433469 RepID=A0A9N8WEL1_9GLOM|nr:3602_t:CDS:2 [Cetraspora pellucida]